MSHSKENDSRSPTPGLAARAEALTLSYGSRVAVDDASFSVPSGRSTAVIGPNGSGKSTVLQALAGLHRPSQGSLRVLGAAAWDRADVAYVPQHVHANEQLPISAREAVTMGRYAHRGALRRLTGSDRAAVQRALERLDVADRAGRQLGELSGGERQRVLVAQALCQEAPLLLLDEALTGLDLPSQTRILEVMAEERDAGRTVVASTHSLPDAARADHVLLLAGRVVAEGPPGEVLTEANIAEAYGAMVVRLGDGAVLVDDTRHHHLN